MSFRITRALLVHGSFRTMLTPLLQEYMQATRQETGCLSLVLYQHKTDPHLYLLEGQWQNEIAYLSHLDQLPYRRFLRLTASMLLEPAAYANVVPLKEIP